MFQAGQTRLRPGEDSALPFGTLGGLVEAPGEGGSDAPRRFLLTCAHVLAPPDLAIAAGPVCDAESGFTLSRRGLATDPFTDGIDVAIAELDVEVNPALPGLGVPTGLALPLEDDEASVDGKGVPLVLFGAKSRREIRSRLVVNAAVATVRYLDKGGHERDVVYKDHHLIDATGFEKGDSGAFVLADGQLVGLLLGVDLHRQDCGVVAPIRLVMAAASKLAGTRLQAVQDFSRLLAEAVMPPPLVGQVAKNAGAKGIGRPYDASDLDKALKSLGFAPGDLPLLAAVMAVESRGFGFLPDRRPQILFERHKFHDATKGRFDQVDPTLSNPGAGGYIGGAAEHDRLGKAIGLCTAAGLTEEPALRSASWGLGQVMGFNCGTVGYDTARAMADDFARGEAAQLAAMVRFIATTGSLRNALATQNWPVFAKGYNGAGFAAQGYDLKLAQAFGKASAGGLPDVALRRVQAALLYLGLLKRPGQVDGFAGKTTDAAIAGWKQRQGKPATAGLTDAEATELLAEAGIG